jgi:nucleoside-triphosphatase THEP1
MTAGRGGNGTGRPPGGRPGSSPLPLNPLWQRAAVLGSLWAASEIVLGSFLHNLRLPLSGHILTAIAVTILVAGHQAWPVKGLLLRAGLIAALMKSVSPSAVLLGPMVAIAMEGVLMELAVRLGRGRAVGYIVGGALAMFWTLSQKVVSLLITYGPDLVRLYGDLIALAERQVGPIPLGPWGPLLILAILNVTVGAAAAVMGIRLGRITRREPGLPAPEGAGERWSGRLGGAAGGGPRPRLGFLAFWLLALPVGLATLVQLSPLGKGAMAGAAVLLAVTRYGRALRRLARPGFWLTLVAVTMLAGAIAGGLSSEDGAGWWSGLGMGLGMSFHAVFITMCFAALSTELTHPAIRRWMEGLGGGQLHRAIHAAFATLPLVVTSLPPAGEILKRPVVSLGSLLPRLDHWLEALEQPLPLLGVLTGEKGQGKTTRMGEVVEKLRDRGVRVGGVLAPGQMRDGKRWSMDLVDLGTGRRIPMATRDPGSPWPKVGAFHVNPEALELGRRALSPAESVAYDLVVLDEVGPWELAGQGWSSVLERWYGGEVPLLPVVRRSLVQDVMARLAPGGGVKVWDIGLMGISEMTEAMLEELERHRRSVGSWVGGDGGLEEPWKRQGA